MALSRLTTRQTMLTKGLWRVIFRASIFAIIPLVVDPAAAQEFPQTLLIKAAADIPVPYSMTYSYDKKVVRVQMADADSIFFIPRNYIDLPGRFGDAATVKDLLLFSLLPDLAGREPKNSSKFDEAADPELLTILLSTPRTERWDLSRVEDAYAQDWGRYGHQNLGPLYGLSGIRQVPPNSRQGWQWKYVFRQGSEGSPSVSIVCNGEGTVPYPSCIHHFLYKSLLVRLDYAKTNLPQWELIEQSVRTKLDSWAHAQP